MDNILFLIPARGGSKGIPGKNIKLLDGKPLICYSIDVARKFVRDEYICVSSDDDKIIKVVEDYGLKVPFKRPAELATDTAGSDEVIAHALKYYENKGDKLDWIVLLQPTSPFRKEEHVRDSLKLCNKEPDMVVGVQKTKANPYTVLFEEENGILKKSKTREAYVNRRQDAPVVYQINGAIYIINVTAFKKYQGLSGMENKIKYVMDDLYSIDLDDMLDWDFAEFLIEKKKISL